MSDEVLLAEPDANWPVLYRAARDELVAVLDQVPLLIEHFGSTAVPGLPAKPVIDIIVLVEDMAPILAQLERIEALGYAFRPAVSTSERLFLRRQGVDGIRTHHLHFHTDAADVRRHLLFRDLLRRDEAARMAYLELKRELARRHMNDREAYTKGKDHFIDAMVEAAGGPKRKPFWTA